VTKQFNVWLIVFFLAGVALAPRAFVSATTGKAAATRKAVVVELFTSEGCSSCPPADQLLSQLRQEKQVNGTEIIPLGFHVDYWDYQGWRDRFDSAAYTRRQETYADHFHLPGSYTPQMVVDGAEEFAGNSAMHARAAIARAATQPQQTEIEITSAKPDTVNVQVKAPAAAAGEVLLAVTEDNLESKVRAGENEGHVLRHSAVVRELRLLGKLKDGSFTTAAPLKLDKDWKPKDLRLVVLVQEPASGKIIGAAAISATLATSASVSGGR
jgi:hypothetical protein